MAEESSAQRPETPGKAAAYLYEPPQEKNFKAHLEWHLFDNGTRPAGAPGIPGEPWAKDEFAEALGRARGGRTSRYRSDETVGDPRRSLNGWLRGGGCQDAPWGLAVETALFGKIGANPAYDAWRRRLRSARRARIQEGHRSDLYVRDQIPERVRNSRIERMSHELATRGWRTDILEHGSGCTNPAFNRRLLVSRPVIPLRILPNRWRAYDYYHDDLRIFARAKADEGSGDYRNDAKVRAANDFMEDDAKHAAIQESDYLSSLMTDQIAWSRIRSKELQPDGVTPDRTLWDGISAFVEGGASDTPRLKGLGEAQISNQLGGSTLAFSNDGQLMIVAQSDKNLQSENLLAPSGSGSFDWADVEASGAKDLLALVKYGAERELREECALNVDGLERRLIASDVIVTGFVRMLRRAGKPEFLCLGRIDATADEIRERKTERYVEKVLAAQIRHADWEAHRPSEEISRVCDSCLSQFLYRSDRVPMSYPLEQALKLLGEACADPASAAAIDAFLRSPRQRHDLLSAGPAGVATPIG